MDTPLIEFKDVTKRFGSKTVLDSVNLKIYEGEVTTIIGLSGSGKSVLLKHIIGLIEPDSGTILFRGKPLAEMKRKETAASLAKISYMFQDNALFDSLTVEENIGLPLRETTNLSKAEIDRRVAARMEQTELSDAAHKYPSELSGGMQKRAALARALVTDPRIVLFDEPTSGQDPVRSKVYLLHVGRHTDHREDHIASTGRFLGADAPDGAQRKQLRCFLPSTRIDGGLIARLNEAAAHGFAHYSRAYPSDLAKLHVRSSSAGLITGPFPGALPTYLSDSLELIKGQG